MKIIILLSLLAGVFGQLTPNLSVSPEDIERDFHQLDLNKDGNLEPNEVFAVYDRIDVNGDQFMSKDEFTRLLPSEYPPDESQAMFKYFDKLDGTNDDRIARINITFLFNMLDTDKNGSVSLAEFQRNIPTVVSGILKEVEASRVVG